MGLGTLATGEGVSDGKSCAFKTQTPPRVKAKTKTLKSRNADPLNKHSISGHVLDVSNPDTSQNSQRLP
jgi:hypothetical protein